jgi:uncharacterized membrane protein YhaH (DUF805 family)
MDWGNYLFGFDGRINRAKIWIFIAIAIVAYLVFGILFSVIFGGSIFFLMMMAATRPAALFASGGPAIAGVIAFCAFYLFIFYVGLAVSAKRLHDRNKGAIWLVIFIVLPFVLNIAGAIVAPPDLTTGMPSTNPIKMVLSIAAFILTIWGFVELYCLRGTVGDNQYGPDPLAGKV